MSIDALPNEICDCEECKKKREKPKSKKESK